MTNLGHLPARERGYTDLREFPSAPSHSHECGERLFVTRQEAARILSLSVTEIDDARRAGKLLAKRHGRKVLIPVHELERYADSLPWIDPK